MQPREMPSASDLRTCFDYDAASGLLYWKEQATWTGQAAHRKKLVGQVAGTKAAQGYIKIKWRDVHMQAHRVIWKMVHGMEPRGCIDHINSVPWDNRLVNLREASYAQNCANRSNQKGRALPKGVHFSKGRYRVMIGVGSFDTPEEARAAYDKVARFVFGEFANSK